MRSVGSAGGGAGPSFSVGEHRLTEREVDVVRRLARGLSNAEIAAEARLSRLTVKAHLSSILAKVGLTSQIQVVVWAYEHGLVRPGEPGAP